MNIDIRNLSKWLNEEQETPIDRQALARVLAMAEQPAQQQPVALEQERKAFEEWIDSGFINKGHAAFHKFSDRDAYCIDEIQNKWKAWEERAKRTTPQAQPAQPRKPLTDEQQIAEALRRHGLTLVKTAKGYDVMSLGHIAAHGIKEQP